MVHELCPYQFGPKRHCTRPVGDCWWSHDENLFGQYPVAKLATSNQDQSVPAAPAAAPAPAAASAPAASHANPKGNSKKKQQKQNSKSEEKPGLFAAARAAEAIAEKAKKDAEDAQQALSNLKAEAKALLINLQKARQQAAVGEQEGHKEARNLLLSPNGDVLDRLEAAKAALKAAENHLEKSKKAANDLWNKYQQSLQDALGDEDDTVPTSATRIADDALDDVEAKLRAAISDSESN
jgi:hypothetical protein